MPTETTKKMRPATARRRREILDAALVCFLEKGVEGTSIEQIQSISGASHGSIYHLFKSKNEIACTLYLEGMQDYHIQVLDAVQAASSAYEKIRAIIHTHLQVTVKNPALSLYLTRQGLSDGIGLIRKQFCILNNEFATAVFNELKPCIEKGELLDLDSSCYFSLITGPCSHLARAWLRNQIDNDLLHYVDQFAECAWKSLARNNPEWRTQN